MLLALTAGCGGGVYVDATVTAGPPPTVAVVAVATATPVRGDAVQIVATVSASNGIDYVSFYRLDFNGPTLLGTVGSPPATWDTSIPVNAGGTVSYYARACDALGECTDSQAVTLAVY
jgi:hypothetical protein